MIKIDFLRQQDVRDFVDWVTSDGDFLPIHLVIKKSKFVPATINANIVGLQNVIAHYRWKSAGMNVGDWPECFMLLQNFSTSLKQAVTLGNNTLVRSICRQILTWGGNRNWDNGAWPFLEKLPSLSAYLGNAEAALRLANANTRTLVPPIGLMNSMLTKVHALASSDGLPIYDSRVAVAIASLVELWRTARRTNGQPLPETLTFPAAYNSRTVNDAFPAAVSPGVIGGANATVSWASAKVRLGWLMEKILERNPSWFADPTLFGGNTPTSAMRMHALEASLFMIGYDPNCMIGNATVASSTAHGLSKTVQTFSGRGKEIQYVGSLAKGFKVQWGGKKFELSAGLITDIAVEFGGENNVKLGASEDNPPVESFGYWLSAETKHLSRDASAIGPILVSEGLATVWRDKRRGFYLDFK